MGSLLRRLTLCLGPAGLALRQQRVSFACRPFTSFGRAYEERRGQFQSRFRGPSYPGASQVPLPNPMLIKPTTPKELLRHLSALLTRHGCRGEWIVARVQHQLQVRYRHPQPIQVAIDAVKPVIRYYKSKTSKAFIPIALYPSVSEATALRWLIQAARNRTYVGNRPDIIRGLVDELDAIIQGTSALFRKRFDTHRNPN